MGEKVTSIHGTRAADGHLPTRVVDYLDDRWDDAVRLSAVLKCLGAACARAESDVTLLPSIELGIAAAFDEAERLADKLDPQTVQQMITDQKTRTVPTAPSIHPNHETEE